MRNNLLILLFLLPALLTARCASAADEQPVHKFSGSIVTNPDRPEAESTNQETIPASASTANASAFSIQALSSGDISLYRVWFDFTRDDDGDGYYHQFDINIDLDTRLSSAQIYVTGHLNGGQSGTPLFRTDPFTIRGASGNDSYRARVLLSDGYPAGRYELTLRVYDAHDNALLLVHGPQHDSDMAELFLEDVTREAAGGDDVELFTLEFTLSADRDGDRYYTQADVRFDADAPGQTLTLYGSLFLIDHQGRWIPLRNTDTFTVSNYAHGDAVTTGFDLNTGFDPQHYRLALEIHDAHSHAVLLTTITPDNAPLRMESDDYDSHYDGADDHHDNDGSGGSGGSGGTMTPFLLIPFSLLLLRRRLRQ